MKYFVLRKVIYLSPSLTRLFSFIPPFSPKHKVEIIIFTPGKHGTWKEACCLQRAKTFTNKYILSFIPHLKHLAICPPVHSQQSLVEIWSRSYSFWTWDFNYLWTHDHCHSVVRQGIFTAVGWDALTMRRLPNCPPFLPAEEIPWPPSHLVKALDMEHRRSDRK